MGVTDFDELRLRTPLPASQIATPNNVETINFYISGSVTVAADLAAAIVGVAGTIIDVRAYAITAPVGAAMILDVNKNGTTIFTTQAARPTIADGANASSTTAPAVTAVAAGDRLTVDGDQIGSGTAGAKVMVSITIRRAPVA